MAEQRYDLCVVGGGIHGAGVAQAAAARGHSVLVLEKSDLASGTSSRSSKLIHGGLRYLETGQFSLVRESLRERGILLRIAPDLVKLQAFFIPVYRNSSRRSWQIRLGLSLYTILGGLRQDNQFATVPRRDWVRLDGLSTKDLLQVYRYRDAQTDDARLTRAVMASATALGAELVVPARFVEGRIHADGVELCYECDGHQHSCRARVLVNAAGPWVAEVVEFIKPIPELPATNLVQGTHVIVSGTLSKGMYYLEAPQDRRAVFVMPWKGHTLVGTTETAFLGKPDDVVPLQGEQGYLLEVLHHYFPRFQDRQQGEVLTSFAGLRVLPAGSGGFFQRPREILLVTDHPSRPRLITLLGGKLTVYRATAEKVLQRLQPVLPDAKYSVDTSTLLLPQS